jgi:hypothetical protein
MGTGMPLARVCIYRGGHSYMSVAGRQYSLLLDDTTLSASRILFNIDQCLANL